MDPISFPEQNSNYAENQPEYLLLPAHKTEDGRVITCWRFTFWERIRLLWSGIMWFHVLTFGRPLQPQAPALEYPFNKVTK